MVTIETRDFFKGNVLAHGVIASVSGGTVSAMMGGKFANGAMTGAFGYLLNETGLTRTHERSHTVELFVDEPTSSLSGVGGHVAINVDGIVFSRDSNEVRTFSREEYLANRVELGKTTSSVSINASPSETRQMLSALSLEGQKYNLFVQNCATTVWRALASAGIVTSRPLSELIVSPRDFLWMAGKISRPQSFKIEVSRGRP
jgi:hypothetical protein